MKGCEKLSERLYRKVVVQTAARRGTPEQCYLYHIVRTDNHTLWLQRNLDALLILFPQLLEVAFMERKKASTNFAARRKRTFSGPTMESKLASVRE